MIVGKDWIWLHVPKCAGSTTEKMLQALYGNDPAVRFDKVDPRGQVIWHQSLAERRKLDPDFDPGARRVIGNLRRLPSWILSRIHFEVQRSGAGGVVGREMLVQGRFRNRPKKGRVMGQPATADASIEKYGAEVTNWVRSEALVEDLSAVLGFDPARAALEKRDVNRGQIEYIRDLSFWFRQPEIDRMYQANPIWAELEREVYGDLLRL